MIEFKLLKINIFNFACYYGDNVLDFTEGSDADHNIFLFKLPNGFGKTSLFHAIKWGFYGEDVEFYKDSDKIDVKDFLNDRLDPSKDMFFVEIHFKYGSSNYTLRREYVPSSKKYSTLILSRDGELIVDDDEKKEELNNILPTNFADFFMFDGEQLSRFMSAQKELNFRDSIHQLLGLKQLRVLKDDLDMLRRRYETELTQQTTKNKDVEMKKNLIKGINREINNLNTKIKKCKEEITTKESTKEDLEDRRNQYENLPDVMIQMQAVDDQISDLNAGIERIKTNLENRSEELFVTFIKSDLESYIETNNERIDYLQDVCGLDENEAEIQTVKEKILAMSIPKCNVCGHRLDEDELKRLEEEQNEIKEKLKHFGENKKERNVLKDENNLYADFLKNLQDFNYVKELDLLYGKMSKLDDLKKKQKDLRIESRKEEYGSLAEINREVEILQDDIASNRNSIKLFEEKIKEYDKEKANAARAIKAKGHDDAITANTADRLEYVSQLIDKLDLALERGTISKRDLILKRSNELFLKITNKPDEYGGIAFENDDSYAFVIKTKDGRTVKNPSKGEKQVLAMSFLLGLSQYTGRNNVILMDTPVASLDDVHSAGIGKALANLDNQVIFLAQPQELQGDIYKNMVPAVAKEYTVVREDFISKFNEE